LNNINDVRIFQESRLRDASADNVIEDEYGRRNRKVMYKR